MACEPLRMRITKALATAVSVAACAGLVGCLPRDRLNDACQWSHAAGFAIDPARRAHQRHLAEDAKIAEELGIRHGDSLVGRESIDERRRRREQCTATLFHEIARLHGVALDDVQASAIRRDTGVDVLLVLLPMAVFFLVVSDVVARRIFRRFPPDEMFALVGATLLASLAVSLFVLLISDIWSWLVESARLRDSHLSYRAARRPWAGYPREVFAVGVLAFWFVSGFRYRNRMTDRR
jgi:hypothetical protein